jgi:signal transduction histidine kinase
MDPPETGADLGHAAEAVGGRDPPDGILLRQLADEQAALRRVATLVARGALADEVFAAVPEEAGQLLQADQTTMIRYGSDATSTVVASWRRTGGAVPPIGAREWLGGNNLTTVISQTGRSARIDDYADASGAPAVAAQAAGFRAAAGAPIIVQGRVWGAIVACSVDEETLPRDTEVRLASFTELVAAAVGNARAEQELRELADTQAALRRLATLVARGEPAEVVFAAATGEALRHFGGGTARMIRYEADGTATLVANEGTTGPHVRVGERWQGYPPGGLTATVRRTGRAARVGDYAGLPGGQRYLAEGLRSAVAVPIHVNGRLWGMIAVGSGQAPLPPGTEARMSEFTDLVATAVANAQNRAELITSRARIVAASDQARARIERDLHDGAQQRLLALALKLRATTTTATTGAAAGATAGAAAGAAGGTAGLAAGVAADVADGLIAVIDELREISRGIHPAILSRAGLPPALRALARRSAVPAAIHARIDGRLPGPVEVGAYYVVSEMLTNAARHARATTIDIHAHTRAGTLRLSVHDNGIGGADPARGTGLTGLKDRIDALGGTLTIHSPPGAGTTVTCELPAVPLGGAGQPDAGPRE